MFWNWEAKAWEPYSDNGVYLEISMMTPKYREYLKESKDRPGHYYTRGMVKIVIFILLDARQDGDL